MKKSFVAPLLAMVAACAPSSHSIEGKISCSDVQPSSVVPANRIGQRGGGLSYEMLGTEVWDVPDPSTGRAYQVFVSLPASYAEQPDRRFPVLYVTDADYAFPIVRQISRRLNGEGPAVSEFILIGLSYAVGEDGMTSRRRDYTPTPRGAASAPVGSVHGMGSVYLEYIRDHVIPFVASRYRTKEEERYFLGHSYGALLGTQILFSEPGLFRGFILGSPSYWYDAHHMNRVEESFAARNSDLPARIYMYVGEYEETRLGDPRFAKRYNMVTDSRRMVSSLRSRNFPSLQVHLDVLKDEDHLSVAPGGFTRGLKFIFAEAEAPSDGRDH